MIELNTAIGIHQHQRAWLIEETGGEGDTKFYRRQRQPLFQIRVAAVKFRDSVTSCGVFHAILQLLRHLLQQVLPDGLVIMRNVADFLTVVIIFAYRQRIQTQFAGNMINDVLNRHNALRAAKSAVSGVRRKMSFTAITGDQRIAEVIGVIGMEHGAIDDRTGEIQRITAVGRQFNVDTVNDAVIGKPYVIADMKRMALAGDQHVILTRQPHFCRTSGQMRRQRGKAGCTSGLRLFAAKTPAHASHINHDFVHRQIQHRGHQFLHFCRMLCRAVHQHRAVFAGHH
ncbi:hypothetical protein SRABI106_03105 [Rahnella aquatilis]|nr:hypothetical protein SRABI106_03105 [Rahnella aquatilis]